jgi:hypothetical protein
LQLTFSDEVEGDTNSRGSAELRSNGYNGLYEGVRISDPITKDADFVRVVAPERTVAQSRWTTEGHDVSER